MELLIIRSSDIFRYLLRGTALGLFGVCVSRGYHTEDAPNIREGPLSRNSSDTSNKLSSMNILPGTPPKLMANSSFYCWYTTNSAVKRSSYSKDTMVDVG